jgi:unspecific monooxygenase
MSDAQPLIRAARAIPAMPPPPTGTTRVIARSLQDNAIGLFPPQAFEDDVFHRRFLGKHQLILSRPAAIHHILVENTENYRRTNAGIRILRPLLGQGLLLSKGEDWKHQRRSLAPAFAPRTMPLLARHVATAAADTVAELDKSAGRPVDLLAAMQFLALEIAGRSMFSLEMARHGREMRALIKEYAAHLGRPSVLDMLLPPGFPSPRDLARWRFRRRWLDLIRRLIAERRGKAAEAAPRDLLDLLSAARDPESGAPFGPGQLADQVATMIVAGHETTAVALFWSMLLIAGEPAVQDRLAAEASGLDLVPDRAAAALPELVYARAVVHEVLRLYPPAFTMARQAIGADVAGGVAIPARAIVLIAPWVLHRHRRLWREPERFDPDRFLPGVPPPDRFAYLPFGVGPRVCIGAQFALTEATLVLAAMVRAFRIERADDAPVVPRGIVTTQPDHAPPFLLQRRDSA